MASLNQLVREGLAGFSPDWYEHTGRAYRWRVKTHTPSGSLKTWDIGDWFESASACDNFRAVLSRKEWRERIASGLVDGSDEVSVEIVYKDFEDGRPAGRLSVLRGIAYPVTERSGRAAILWAKGEEYGRRESLPAVSKNDVFDAQVSRNISWYVFVWEGDEQGCWRHVASIARKEDLDGFVDMLKRSGEEVRVVDKPEL